MKLCKEVSDRPIDNLTNKRGFALVETIAALAILSFVLLGLMVMVQYARARAITNYHDRYVLYRVDGELQRLKEDSVRFGQRVPQNVPNVQFTIPHSANPNNRQQQPIVVTVRFSTSTHRDYAAADNVYFTAVTALAEWDEYRALGAHSRRRAERRYIQLREDYFFKSTRPLI
jgi:prepilin-type N-terminal cleavage/methylation domain-containing protein